VRKGLLFLTRNLYNPLLWAERVFWVLMILLSFTLATPDAVKFLFVPALLCCVTVIVYPRDEIGFSHDHLYFVRRSVFRRFTSVDRYKITDIVSLKLRLEPQGRYNWNEYRVEIIFSDDSSRTLFLKMRRRVLEFVFREVIRLRDEKLKLTKSV
jgi:hypothetical protein